MAQKFVFNPFTSNLDIVQDVVGVLDFQGSYDASTNTPDLDTSPSSTILKGWAYVVSVAGTFFTESVVAGDFLIADTDAPTALTDWIILNKNIDITEVTGTTQQMAVNNEYIANNASRVTLTLPTTASVGDFIKITGKGAGGWQIAQNANQKIHFGRSTTETGTGGEIRSNENSDSMALVNIVANNEWTVIDSVGNFTVIQAVGLLNEKSVTFDGTNDYVSINNVYANQLIGTAKGTWSTWVKPVNSIPSTTRVILSFGTLPGSDILYFYVLPTSGKLRFEARVNGANKWVLDTDVNPFTGGVWTHIAIVQDGISPIIYVNGVAVAQSFVTDVDRTLWFGSANMGTNQGRIGDLAFSFERFFYKGSIDEVTFWDTDLSEADILSLYNSGSPSDPLGHAKVNNLAAYFKMGDGDTFPTLIDSSNSNDGTMVNMTSGDIVTDAVAGSEVVSIINASIHKFIHNADGFTLGGGVVERTLDITGADLTLSLSGDVIQTIPSTDHTVAGLELDNTFTGDNIFQSATDSTTAFQILDNDGGDPVFNVDTVNERVGIGTDNPERTLDVWASGTNSQSTGRWFTYNDQITFGSVFVFGKSHTDTAGSLVTTLDNEVIGTINFEGIDANNAVSAVAKIRILQDGAASGSNTPGEILFQTSSTTLANITRLTIKPNGDIILGSGVAGYDQVLIFDGETNDGVITWKEDEDRFRIEDDVDMNAKFITNLSGLHFNSASELTISSGVVTATQGHHSIDTEGDAANDDLDTIDGGNSGEILFILPNNDARTVRIRHGVGNIFLKHQVESKSFSFSSPAGSSGTFYSGGYYNWSTADANLTQASLSVTHSAANSASACHIAIVAAGAGTVDTGVVKLTISGTTIDDNGVRATSQTVDLVADITTLSTNQYVETSEKWIGQVTIALAVASGSPVNFSLDLNYGCSKYEDFGNQAFTVTVLECVGLAGANDTGFNLRLFHHSSTGWTYAATGFVPGGTVLANMNTDYSTEQNLTNGESFAYKRVNLNTDISGENAQGLILEITTSANKAVEIMDIHFGVHTAPNFAYLATTKQHLIFMKHGPNWLEL